MTVLMFFVIYFGSVVLLCSYNFITCGNFWRTDYSALNRKWFFFYSLIIESIILIVLPQVRYLFNEPYIISMLGTILFVLVLIDSNMGTQYIG